MNYETAMMELMLIGGDARHAADHNLANRIFSIRSWLESLPAFKTTPSPVPAPKQRITHVYRYATDADANDHLPASTLMSTETTIETIV